MNITSYNVTDVGYHYIGLRVIASLSTDASRDLQITTISRNVLKYASDKALRLMLPAPRGDFQAVGEKICQELVHLGLAEASYGKGYALTDSGADAIQLLNGSKYSQLRRKMVALHLTTYDNLRQVVSKHLDAFCVWSPVVDAKRYNNKNYIERLLKPTFGAESDLVASRIVLDHEAKTAKKMEDVVRDTVLEHVFSDMRLSLALFRSMSDRLVSLRLLNIMKAIVDDCEFAKSYSPCRSVEPKELWFRKLSVSLTDGKPFDIYLSEPDMKNSAMLERLLVAIDESFLKLSPQAGYFELPQVRDHVCEQLLIPEAAFDEGVNSLLDLQPAPVTVGLTYEGISGRRKPLVRNRQTIQIFNLIRRV